MFVLWLVRELNEILRLGLDYRDADPVPFRINPSIVSMAGFSLLVCAVVSVFILTIHRLIGRVAVLLAFIAVLIPFTMLVISAYPSANAVYIRDMVAGSGSSPGRKSFGFPVYFDDNISKPGSNELQRVKDSFSIFRHCEASTVSVKGFASSKEFEGKSKEQSEQLNLALANARASTIGGLIFEMSGQQPVVVAWPDYASMLKDRRIRDVTSDGARIKDAERLNRRAEIFWNDSACIGD
jgi:hypothetical protein